MQYKVGISCRTPGEKTDRTFNFSLIAVISGSCDVKMARPVILAVRKSKLFLDIFQLLASILNIFNRKRSQPNSLI